MIEERDIELAVFGETGVDIFVRRDDVMHSRVHFLCIASLSDTSPQARLVAHEALAPDAEARFRALAQGLEGDMTLSAPLSLTDTRTWPRIDGLNGFLYMEFFRAWQVADQAARRFVDTAAADPVALLRAPGLFTGPIRALYDFNRPTHGIAVAQAALPALEQAARAPGFTDDPHRNLGYGFRMLGDLCGRGGRHDLALSAYALSVACGDNEFRRSKAIEAAHAVANRPAFEAHRAAYAAQWALPGWLADLTIPDGA